jgi:hypothetical protein
MSKESVKAPSRRTVVLVAACAALTVALNTGGARVSATSNDDRDEGERHVLRVTKECSQYTRAAGSFCTITGSNVPGILVGSRVTYDQAAGIPAGLLDSNVVLDAGGGNRAVGRCTLDLSTGLGLCTFSDGTGGLAGFRARAKVSPPTDGVNWHWDGTYSFTDVD